MNTQRLRKLQSIIQRPHLVKKRENLLYLTGADFIHGYLLVFPESKPPVFFGDGLEKINQAKSDFLFNIGKYIRPGAVLDVESQLTLAEADYIKKYTKKIKIISVSSVVDIIRAIKEPAEILAIRKSMEMVAKVFGEVKKNLAKKIWTEIELADYIKIRGLQLGAEDVSFQPIVAAGENAAIPHHKPTKRKLKAGESIVIDMGYKVQGYCSDFTRTVFLKKITKKMENLYRQTALASRMAFAAAKTGIKAKELDKVARSVLENKKLGKYFIHSLGHGTGLEVHEWPRISEASNDKLQDGMVFSIEPGVYIKNLGGVRIEDLVYLEKEACRHFIDVSTTLADNIV